jgi:FKBP-type peptidyl-prolyl cis-trans isomerase 2
MAQAKMGDTVHIHYTGQFENGEEFDSSRGREPLSFTLGSGDVIPGFENAILGMNEKDKKTVSLPPDQAYGERMNDLVMTVSRDQVPPDITPEVGMQLGLSNEEGQSIPVTITEVTDETITLDANSPMAGKTLIFDLELVKIA